MSARNQTLASPRRWMAWGLEAALFAFILLTFGCGNSVGGPPDTAAAAAAIPTTPTGLALASDRAAEERLNEERVARGSYLVTIGGCDDCHTPWIMGTEGPEPDMTRRLQGHPEELPMPPAPALGDSPWGWTGAATNTAFAGPWGVSFTANLTPDEMTGTGIWTEEMFINTIRNGRHWGVARPLLPPMPWQNYRQMTDEDLKSVFAFLRSLEPIRNQVPLPIPPPGAQIAEAEPPTTIKAAG